MIPRRFSAHGHRSGTLLWSRRDFDEQLVSKVYGYKDLGKEPMVGLNPFTHSFRGVRTMNTDTSSDENPQSID